MEEQGMVSDRRLWLTADRTRVVEEGDPEAAHLLVAQPEQLIPQSYVERLGLELKDGRVCQSSSAREPEPAPGEPAATRGRAGRRPLPE